MRLSIAVSRASVVSFVAYGLLVLGVPEVPARASFCVDVGIYPTCAVVGTLGSLSHTAIGIAALTGATERRVLPAAAIVASVYADVSILSVLRLSKLSLIVVRLVVPLSPATRLVIVAI